MPSAAPHRTPPSIGLVIPTFNRWPTLRLCLQHLERQSEQDFEVVVVDDGSTDETATELNRYASTSPYPVRVLRQANAGPATARNRAIRLLDSPTVILLGDDTFPRPGFIAAHLAFHRANTALEAVAVGLTVWHEERQTVSPLMRWIASEGPQFRFAPLLRGAVPTWEYFYTSNLSAKTDYLQAHPFDETFSGYGFEDIELGYRLAARHGLRIHFLPDAVTEHLHPTTYDQVCRRARQAGAGEYHFATLWPERRLERPTGLKGVLLRLAGEPRFILPLLTRAGRIWTRLHCPNPLLGRVLQLQSMAGYDGAAAQQSLPAARKPEDRQNERSTGRL